MLQWTTALATGNDDIDIQHQEIFAKLNAIESAIHSGAPKDSLLRLITALLDYAYIHFHHEEHAMNCSRCPFHDSNCDAHRHFIQRLRSWLALIMAGGTSDALLHEIHAESCHWIINHITKVDIGLLQKTRTGLVPSLQD